MKVVLVQTLKHIACCWRYGTSRASGLMGNGGSKLHEDNEWVKNTAVLHINRGVVVPTLIIIRVLFCRNTTNETHNGGILRRQQLRSASLSQHGVVRTNALL